MLESSLRILRIYYRMGFDVVEFLISLLCQNEYLTVDTTGQVTRTMSSCGEAASLISRR